MWDSVAGSLLIVSDTHWDMVSFYRTLRRKLGLLQTVATLCIAGALPAAEIAVGTSPPAQLRVPSATLPSTAGGVEGRWVSFAQGISEITAAAVSPLLVVSVIGANRYLRAPAAERPNLPFFCNPLLWGTGLTLLFFCFLKDVLGALVPAALKKPADMVELFESKLSALVASTLFVPVVAWEMVQQFGPSAQIFALPADVQWASVFPSAMAGFDLRWLVIIPAVLSFLAVWLTSHVINVLVVISPFSLVDSILKMCRNAILAVLVLASAVSPYLGGALSLLLLLGAVLIAGRSFRFAVFGAVLAWDVLTVLRSKRRDEPVGARAFIVKPFRGIPSRTYGRLERGEAGVLTFQYRPWLLFSKREVVLPEGIPILRRDILFVSLLLRGESGEEVRVMEFPPRYRPQVEALAAVYQVSEIRDGAVVEGVKAAKRWILEMFGSKASENPEALKLPAVPRPS